MTEKNQDRRHEEDFDVRLPVWRVLDSPDLGRTPTLSLQLVDRVLAEAGVMDVRTLADGYYWCSHDLNWWLPPGATYPEQWQVVQALGEQLFIPGSDRGFSVDGVPDYVTVVRLIEPTP